MDGIKNPVEVDPPAGGGKERLKKLWQELFGGLENDVAEDRNNWFGALNNKMAALHVEIEMAAEDREISKEEAEYMNAGISHIKDEVDVIMKSGLTRPTHEKKNEFLERLNEILS